MHKWNPSIQQIKVSRVTGGGRQPHQRRLSQLRPGFFLCVPTQVLKHVGAETVVTHEVSAPTAGNLIGQRDFVCVRHSRKHKSHVYLSGAAVQMESFPPLAGFVRYPLQLKETFGFTSQRSQHPFHPIEADHGRASRVSITQLMSTFAGRLRHENAQNAKRKHGALFLHRAEDGPSCILIQALGARKTHFTWLLNMDVKVNLP